MQNEESIRKYDCKTHSYGRVTWEYPANKNYTQFDAPFHEENIHECKNIDKWKVFLEQIK